MTGAFTLLSACSEKKQSFSAIDITGADYARDFALTDHNGQPRSILTDSAAITMDFSKS